jgi:hypothetical protein
MCSSRLDCSKNRRGCSEYASKKSTGGARLIETRRREIRQGQIGGLERKLERPKISQACGITNHGRYGIELQASPLRCKLCGGMGKPGQLHPVAKYGSNIYTCTQTYHSQMTFCSNSLNLAQLRGNNVCLSETNLGCSGWRRKK